MASWRPRRSLWVGLPILSLRSSRPIEGCPSLIQRAAALRSMQNDPTVAKGPDAEAWVGGSGRPQVVFLWNVED